MIVLTGEPRTTNALYRSHCKFGHPCIYMTNEGKALKESYQWQAKSQWKKKPLNGNVNIDIHLYFGTKRNGDIDNYGKILLDSLSGIVWVDDKQIQQMTVTKGYDKSAPRIEVEIL